MLVAQVEPHVLSDDPLAERIIAPLLQDCATPHPDFILPLALCPYLRVDPHAAEPAARVLLPAAAQGLQQRVTQPLLREVRRHTDAKGNRPYCKSRAASRSRSR